MKKVLYVTSRLPALTVTFIYKEIQRLQASGRSVSFVSMNTPSDDEVSADAADVAAATDYLDQIGFLPKLAGFLAQFVRHPARGLESLRILLSASPMQGGRDWARLVYHLLEAGYLARRYRHRGFGHIHCHFINGPTSIGMFLGVLLDVPYSFTMHASMIWLDPIAFRNKLETAKFCASISEYNKRYVLETYGQEFASKIHIVHCGIDPELPSLPAVEREDESIRLLGLGQLNPRKGFHVLIEALALLKGRERRLRCAIVGGGEQRAELERAIDTHELEELVSLEGAVPHERVKEYLSASDIFVLPCVVSDDGWRDGIPVALMEAMFHRRPVISTDILGLPELIDSGESGVLVPSNDPVALANAILELAADAQARRRMGERGREKVLESFNNEKSVAALGELFDAA